PTMNSGQKIQQAPYYLFYKKQYWLQTDYATITPGQTHTTKYEYGITETDQESMTTSVEMSIGFDAGLQFKMFSSSLSYTITEQLQTYVSTTTEEMTQQTIEDEI
ncbi:hypothetical protein FC697_22490, partial [Bacillus wiedmannii]